MTSSYGLVSLITLAAVLSTIEGARVRWHNPKTQALVLDTSGRSTSAVEKHGMLSVRGNKIVDKTGAPVRLRGMSLFWSQWMPQFWNADVVSWLKNDWQSTVVRAAMGIEHGGYLENPLVETARMEAVVDAAIAAGIYVVIDWHDHKAEEHLEQAKAFFDEMARKYGSYPNVLFELYNEPTQQSWPGIIKPFHESVIPVIRQHTKNIIILGTRLWSQEVGEASEDPVVGDNLAYTIHFYANTHRQSLRNKVSTALANGVPVFATEWGTCDATGDGTLDLGETQAWLKFFEENHISDANWAIGDKAEACSALKPGASGNGGWSEDHLTESGRFVRASMRGEETGVPLPTGGCCKWGAECGGCGPDGAGWCHDSSANCGACGGIFDTTEKVTCTGR
jgi:endoglucanase